MTRLLEVCVDSAESLVAAVEGGADRVELCAALELGGITPTVGLMRLAVKLKIPCTAMVRPRSGDFAFSAVDIAAMMEDIQVIRDAGVNGVVLGASLESGALDVAVLTRLCRQANGLGLTLHRAFDLVPDIENAIDTAVDLGFQRILTSGGAQTAPFGMAGLLAATKAARGRISIMPGSGIAPENVQPIIHATGATEVHSSCSVLRPGMGGKIVTLGFATARRRVTSAGQVAALKAAMNI